MSWKELAPFIVFLILAASAVVMVMWYPNQRLRKIRSAPFPETWEVILEANLPVYKRLPDNLKHQLQGLINVFLHQKTFYGCAGLEITDEMRVTIAGEACLLLLNRSTNEYNDLRFILVYPEAFRAEREVINDDGTAAVSSHGLLGESWNNGKVILSWDDVIAGARDFTDGHNVVLHEFAHQLDGESGSTNGAPLLRTPTSYRSWARVLSDEFNILRDSAFKGKKSVMDNYGATNPAEFFAVATETFYEKPKEMAEKHPELFRELRNYYCVDPRDWV
ncbi:uncharacterized protein conserved in bacteria [Hahella chejuensis KCTC 2396]|uniref:Uncharacterized protein conserved in bacteria n=1 Tax=Hahella chejuensis (strain KCTC 2396) TaxID=349521 RepID=Q2SEN3_HAHCH|nr:M90 family metallopeptidase [Hahella chejuensis]ABC30891.1 uncharacterized protein conserved in bacteria [Hahella chejuensis KCTC 2396]